MDVWTDDPHKQINLQTISALNKHSRITALHWGDQNEILIGRADKFVKIYNATDEEFTKNIEMSEGPVIGLGRYNGKIIAGLANGKVQIFQQSHEFLDTGDNLSRMCQYRENQKVIATGGQGRQNNLKLWDLETKTKIFASKNLASDQLQLEVPVWDSDLTFVDANCLATCSRYGYIRMYDTRKQRRPVLEYFNSKEQLVYGCMNAHENVLYVGSTSGIVRAFDARKMKTILHTYKGFTGSVSDIAVDRRGKYVFTACLDRFVRVHCSQTTALQYQCYVKSKATRILQRIYDEYDDQPVGDVIEESVENVNDESEQQPEEEKAGSDSEYEEIFQNMQTIE